LSPQNSRDETGRQFVYDAWNRLVEVKDAAGATLKSYAYDGLHRRVQEIANGVTTDLYYSDGWRVLEERVGGQTTVQYVWSPVYVDALVLRDRDSDADGTLEERLWVVQDANWNVTALIDNSGTVVERYVYDPFGSVTVLDAEWNERSSGSEYDWLYLHQGGRYDITSGLYHFRYRDYSPSLGRWTSLDPIGYAAGDVNLYRTVGNGPTNYVDPWGLDRIEIRPATGGEFGVFYVPEKWFGQGDGPAQYVGKLVEVNGESFVTRHINGQDYYVPLAVVLQTTGFWEDTPSDWRQWIVDNHIILGDDLFREAGRRNNVPNEVIEAIIQTAKSTECEKPAWWEKTHNYCERWAETFERNLQKKLNQMGHKHGLKIATQGGISGPLEKVVFFVPGSFPIFDPDQDHTAMKIAFKDGTTFYIDCGTISSRNINNLTNGPSHFGLPSQIPPSWEQYPRNLNKKIDFSKMGINGMSIDGRILYRVRP
jgi:RHS repeat-associated protein